MQVLEALYEVSLSKGDADIFEDEVLGCISYRDFEVASGKLYRYLLSLNLPKEQIIAIRVKRSYRTFIAIAGALKAAVPYVVVGDTSPQEYIDQVYEDCEPAITLDDSQLDEALECEYLQGYKPRDRHDLAFVAYSTGSSGFFKGSMQEYGAIERIYDMSALGREQHADAARVLENMSFTFLGGFYSVLSIEDLVGVIVYQSKVIIVKTENANDVDHLIEIANKKRIYTMEASPKTLPEFIKNSPSCIKEYAVGYEMHPSKWNPDYKIYNSYGLSESCGMLCFMEIDKDYEITPVGEPVPGMGVKLLGKDGQKAATNEIGELAFVPSYFRGYIKRDDLFRKAYYDGYFHTGDLGFYNDQGDIVIIGRKKDIRETQDGYIVPLYVANAVKREFPDIANCYVKVFDDDDASCSAGSDGDGGEVTSCSAPLIVAYYISEHEHTVEEINKRIQGEIAAYSLPTHAVRLDEFEYFFCGKINSNAFAKPVAR